MSKGRWPNGDQCNPAEAVRGQRRTLLAESDYTQVFVGLLGKSGVYISQNSLTTSKAKCGVTCLYFQHSEGKGRFIFESLK